MAKGMFCTHFFTFESREPFPSTFARGTWWTLKYTQLYAKSPAHVPKSETEKLNLHTGGPGKPGCPWKPLK